MALNDQNVFLNIYDTKNWLEIAMTVETYDARIEMFISQVCDQFNRYTKRLLVARDLTDYYTGDGTNVLYLDQYPVNSITSLHIDAERAYGDSTLIAAADYALYTKSGQITLDSSTFSSSAKAVKVVYNAGYTLTDTATLPLDLKQAALNQIKYYFNRWKHNREGVSSLNFQGESEGRVTTDELLPDVQAILNRYRDGKRTKYN